MEKFDDLYCYPMSDVLINKLDIWDDKELKEEERKITAEAKFRLKVNPLDGNFDFDHLKDIHYELFNEIYKWAGEIRQIHMLKDREPFCLPEHIESYAKKIFGDLKKEKFYIFYSDEITIEKLSKFFSDLNVLHPFRDGNGRTQRIFMEMLCEINGLKIDFDDVSKEEMTEASLYGNYGNFELFREMIIKNHETLSFEKQQKNINKYCSDETVSYILNMKQPKAKIKHRKLS